MKYSLKMFFPLLLDPAAGEADQLDKEPVQTQRRSPMLDENRRDTLIASDASLVTDSIIRGKSIARILIPVCLYAQLACMYM